MSEEEYISSTFSVLILEFSEKYIDSKTVTFYIVEVKNVSKQNWKLEKRYSIVPYAFVIPGKSLFKVQHLKL